MNKTFLSLVLSACSLTANAGPVDSVFVWPYSNRNGDGLHLRWSSSVDGKKADITNGRLVGSDFGAWGSKKKMFEPSIVEGHDGLYVLVFSVDVPNQFGVATTRDFISWTPQHYPYMKGVEQVARPCVVKTRGGYDVVFFAGDKAGWLKTSTTDLIHFTDPVPTAAASQRNVKIPYGFLRSLQANEVFVRERDAKHNERAKDDAKRFEGLGDFVQTSFTFTNDSKPISDKLMGIFFEDINYSADGGLYAELVQNRDFEYSNADRGEWNATTAWTLVGEGATLTIDDKHPIHPNNSHYAVLDVRTFAANNTKTPSVSLQNSGFDGIVLKKGDKYDLSGFLRVDNTAQAAVTGKVGKVNIVLRDGDKVVGRTTLSAPTHEWRQQKAVITATADAEKAVLCVEPTTPGCFAIDFVSLFPQKTFRGHKNGLRADLAETLAALHPKFMRFPGGCVAHGNGIDNIYNWKETIGPLWERKAQPNLWGYHQSKGLGYFEYFTFCEDLGMEPLPVLAAGVPCQNSSHGGHGQQGGIPMEEMDAYVQDVLDLIEWANGDATTTWGRKRAEQGHPKPFNLHYIGIGNEDLISPVFEERYLMLIKAVKERYPDIIVCGTVGPFFEGSDYDRGWQIAADNKIDMVDEHYYCAPGWYLHNRDYYDRYDRSQSKVYLGEYAAHGDGRKSTIETALACAIHLCQVERNADVVAMSSYAPLLAKDGHTQWNPDLIYFNNTEVKPTVDYYVQQLFGQFAGDEYLRSEMSVSTRSHRSDVECRIASSAVRDSKTGRVYLKFVNMLPVEVRSSLSLPKELISSDKLCKATILSGAYDSMTARPTTSLVSVSPQSDLILPSYSMMVIEL